MKKTTQYDINTNFKVTVTIENVLPDGKTAELFQLKKAINSIKKLKKAISELFNSSQKYIREDIEQKEEGDGLRVLMTS